MPETYESLMMMADTSLSYKALANASTLLYFFCVTLTDLCFRSLHDLLVLVVSISFNTPTFLLVRSDGSEILLDFNAYT